MVCRLRIVSNLILLFCSTGIISAGRMHPCLPHFLHRDYFSRLDSSPSCSFVPQGLFRSAGCISSLLFSSTGIISTARMHLYLALLFHRDYFHRPNSSLPGFSVPQGLFRPDQIRPPIAENISARPFRQFKFVLLIPLLIPCTPWRVQHLTNQWHYAPVPAV